MPTSLQPPGAPVLDSALLCAALILALALAGADTWGR
jgi:hypothetical protein